MKFGQRLRRDKKFRLNVILIFVAIVVIAGNTGEDKKEAGPSFDDCNQYNSLLNLCIFTGIDWYWTWGGNTGWGCVGGDDRVGCINEGCIIANAPRAGVNADVCVPLGSTSMGVDVKSDCESGCADYIDGKFWCRACDSTAEKCDGELQQTLADLLDSVWSGNKIDSCQTKFYIVAFGGGFIALMLFMAAM